MPSTVSSTKSKELKPDANFATFGKLFVNPKSSTIPITAIGADHLQTFQNFIAKWQAGKVKDLQGGLVEVDKQIDAKLKQAGGGGNRCRELPAGHRGGRSPRCRRSIAGGPGGAQAGGGGSPSSPS